GEDLRPFRGELLGEKSRVVGNDDAVAFLRRFLEVVDDALGGDADVLEREVFADDPAPARSPELDHGCLPGVRTLAQARSQVAARRSQGEPMDPATCDPPPETCLSAGALCAIIHLNHG